MDDLLADTGPDTLVLEVTAEDILCGEPGSGWACPIARALWRHFPDSWASVGTTARIFAGPDSLTPDLTYDLPGTAHEFMRRYDANSAVHPATFRLTRAS